MSDGRLMAPRMGSSKPKLEMVEMSLWAYPQQFQNSGLEMRGSHQGFSLSRKQSEGIKLSDSYEKLGLVKNSNTGTNTDTPKP